MKKWLISLLAASMLLSFTACGADPAGEEPGGEPVSNTDLVPYEEEPIITEMEGELADLEKVLDRSISLPGAWTVQRCTVIDESIAQLEFQQAEKSYVARAAKGKQENLSDMDKIFNTTETKELNGISVTIRYIDSTKTTLPLTFAVADAYDEEQDLSLCVIQDEFSSVEDLLAAMEALMGSLSGSSAAAASLSTDFSQLPAGEEPEVMEDAICYV
ncbi:MAG: hypothetical protein Q4B50_07515 [Bacillota bacterium]|nr:hypothetical protein [Bacillota bacterium]